MITKPFLSSLGFVLSHREHPPRTRALCQSTLSKTQPAFSIACLLNELCLTGTQGSGLHPLSLLNVYHSSKWTHCPEDSFQQDLWVTVECASTLINISMTPAPSVLQYSSIQYTECNWATPKEIINNCIPTASVHYYLIWEDLQRNEIRGELLF